jgi:hypothetical protein
LQVEIQQPVMRVNPFQRMLYAETLASDVLYFAVIVL